MNYEDRVTKEYVESALASAGVKMVTGTYTGDGSTSRTFNLGFTPRAVIVRSVRTENETQVYESEAYHMPMIAVAGTNYVVLHIVEGGFAINSHRIVNTNGKPYLYIAFA